MRPSNGKNNWICRLKKYGRFNIRTKPHILIKIWLYRYSIFNNYFNDNR